MTHDELKTASKGVLELYKKVLYKATVLEAVAGQIPNYVRQCEDLENNPVAKAAFDAFADPLFAAIQTAIEAEGADQEALQKVLSNLPTKGPVM